MKLFSLNNKNIVVTGATGLLGTEHVHAIAMAGGTPILIDLDIIKINKLSTEINTQYGCNSIGFKVDITNEIEVKTNLELLKTKFRKIDGLINNAANNPKVENNLNLNFSRLENFPIETWDADINVSLKGSFLCTKYYGFEISKNKFGGSIINISSDLGLIAPDQNLYKIDGISENQQNVKPITYSVVKTGLIGLTRYVSTYWSDKNVRCNAICPGGVENNQNQDFINKLIKKIPLGRMAKRNEYQGIIIFLLSDASSYINGSIIAADGGRTAW